MNRFPSGWLCWMRMKILRRFKIYFIEKYWFIMKLQRQNQLPRVEKKSIMILGDNHMEMRMYWDTRGYWDLSSYSNRSLCRSKCFLRLFPVTIEGQKQPTMLFCCRKKYSFVDRNSRHKHWDPANVLKRNEHADAFAYDLLRFWPCSQCS